MATADDRLDLVPVPGQAALLAELEATADQTRAFVDATRAPNTVRAYAADWRDFLGFCAARGPQALPTSPEVVALFITRLASTRRAVTVQRRLAAISQTQPDAGHPTPTEIRLVRKTMAGIRRALGTAPRTKTATRTKCLRQPVLDLPDTAEGIRDRALVLVGFAGAFGRSELVALDRSDMMFEGDGARVLMRASKTDQESAGAVVGLPYGEQRETCPVRALRARLALLPDQRPAVFRRMSRWGTPARVARILPPRGPPYSDLKMARARTTLTRPFRRLTQAELDGFLEKAADILRGNVDHSEFRGYVFALLFFKRISDVYEEEVRKLVNQLGDEELARDPQMHNFVVPEDCLWADMRRKGRNELGTSLNETMLAIERANQPKFDGILANRTVDFNQSDALPREKLQNLMNHFSTQIFDRAHVPDDVFGDAYEYLIRNFASKAGKSSGEFYTPREVAYLMAEMIEPEPGHTVCDWASGSGGLLLQCRNYVSRHRSPREADQVRLHAQESNQTTYNISRINLILHGVPSWEHRHGDSLRDPRLLDDHNELLTFDRIVMNPPFSLEDWGYDDFIGGDPRHRFDLGMPPRDNGDYGWLQHVVATLKPDGRAIVVMSQGVLFRGQPEQTEEEDGRNQKADAEWLIRSGFVRNDLIECVVVLQSKMFYGNNVPACLLVLNKRKAPERRGKILMIWASRDYQRANPQNLLRPSDLMRILVPWRAFGDLERAQVLVPEHEARLIAEEQAERDRRMKDIEDAYAPLLEPLPGLQIELATLEAMDYAAWNLAPNASHAFFGALLWEARDKAKLRAETAAAKKAYSDRVKELKRDIKDLERLQTERDLKEAEVRDAFDREIRHIRESAADLLRICSDPGEAARYFALAEREAIEDNEVNLNLPRYVDTFEHGEIIALPDALAELAEANRRTDVACRALLELLPVSASVL